MAAIWNFETARLVRDTTVSAGRGDRPVSPAIVCSEMFFNG